MAIFIGCAYVYTIIMTAIGPEKRGENWQRDKATERRRLDDVDHEPGYDAEQIPVEKVSTEQY
jgi:hypothetical protein